jgi:hypothetical protein
MHRIRSQQNNNRKSNFIEEHSQVFTDEEIN